MKSEEVSTHFWPYSLIPEFLVFTYRTLHCQAPACISDLLHPVITSRFHLGLLTGAYLLLLGCPSCSTGNKKVIRLLKWLLWHCGRCSAVSDEAFKKQLETHLFKVAFVSPQVFLYCVLFYAFILRMLKIFSSFSSNHCWPFSVKVVLLNQCIVIIITILSNAFIYRCSNLSSYKNLVLN